MRGDPTQIDKATSERDRAARDQFREPDGWERDARADLEADATLDAYEHERAANVLTEDERLAFDAGLAIGARQERRRIVAGLERLEQETAALWQEGTPATKAVAAYTAAVRRVVEGKT